MISKGKKEPKTFYPESRKHWREWLQKNHMSTQSVWLVCYKQKSKMPTITWKEAVEEALCFGWIDSKRISIDDEKFMNLFAQRKPGGTWSKINKETIERLASAGLIAPAGLKSVETAKQNGSWTILDKVEELVIPSDLSRGFRSAPGSRKYFLGLSKSVKKAMLQWIVMAKRPETRQSRIDEIVSETARERRPKKFR